MQCELGGVCAQAGMCGLKRRRRGRGEAGRAHAGRGRGARGRVGARGGRAARAGAGPLRRPRADPAGRPPWQARRGAGGRRAEPGPMVRPCPSVGPRGRLRAWPGARELAPSLRARPARCRRLLPRGGAAPAGGGAEAGPGGGPGCAGGAAVKAGDMTDSIPLQPVRQKKRMDSRPRAG